jgi:hypothetical protein
MTSLNLKLCAAYNTTENNCYLSDAKNTTAVKPKVMLCGICRLLVTKKGRSPLSSANSCQGQMQSPQSVSVQEFVRTLPSNKLHLTYFVLQGRNFVWKYFNLFFSLPFSFRWIHTQELSGQYLSFLTLKDGMVHFRAPKFGLKNTPNQKMFLYDVTRIFQASRYGNQSFIVIWPEYFARQRWYFPFY